MGEQYRFSAPIERSGNGAYVTVPFDAEAVFGKKRVPVRATIDGIAYRGSLVRMGGQRHVLGVLKAIRSALGKGEGDVVQVVIEHDLAPRVVDVPADFAAAMASEPQAARGFEALAYSHKREYVRWIEEAKRDSTRSARIGQAVEMLKRGEKRRQRSLGETAARRVEPTASATTASAPDEERAGPRLTRNTSGFLKHTAKGERP